MEIVQPKSETKTATGTPVIVDDQPATPSSGPDKSEGKAKSASAAVDAAKAKIAGAKTAPAATAATTEAPKTGELTDEQIDAAADRAAAIAEDKAAVVQPESDFASKVAAADKALKAGDHVAAMKALGIDLDEAVRKATGSPATTTKEDELAAENKRLREENETFKTKETQRTAQETAKAAYDATLGAIVADTAFPNISSVADAEKALAPARAAYAALKAELGRDLNQSEKDRLVVRYLKKFNDTAASAQPTPTVETTASVRSGVVVPAKTQKRSIAQVKADILSRKKTN